MKVKDFLEYFKDFDPESELKIELFEEIYDDNIGGCKEFYTPLGVSDTNYSEEDNTVFVTLEWGD